MIKDFFAADEYWKKRLESVEMQLGVICMELGAQIPATRGRLEGLFSQQHSLRQQMETIEVERLLAGDTPAVRWHNQMVQTMGLDVPLLPVEPVLPTVPAEEIMPVEALIHLLRASLASSVCQGANRNGGLGFTEQQRRDAPRLEPVLNGIEEPVNGFYRYKSADNHSYLHSDLWALVMKQDDQVLVVKFPWPTNVMSHTLLPHDKLWVKHSYVGYSWNYARFEADYHAMLLEQYNFLMPPIITEDYMLAQFNEVFGELEFDLATLPQVRDGFAPDFTGVCKNEFRLSGEMFVLVVIAVTGFQMIARLKMAEDGKHWVSVYVHFYDIVSASNYGTHHSQLNCGRELEKGWGHLLPFDQHAVLEKFVAVRDKIVADQKSAQEDSNESAE